MSDDHLPSNIVVGGVTANKETLYIGRQEHDSGDDSDEPLVVPGYIIPSEKTLSIYWNCEKH